MNDQHYITFPGSNPPPGATRDNTEVSVEEGKWTPTKKFAPPTSAEIFSRMCDYRIPLSAILSAKDKEIVSLTESLSLVKREGLNVDKHNQVLQQRVLNWERQKEAADIVLAQTHLALTHANTARQRLREALQGIEEYWNRSTNETAMSDACWHAVNTATDALAFDAEGDAPQNRHILGCPLDTDSDGNCHVHPKGCHHPDYHPLPDAPQDTLPATSKYCPLCNTEGHTTDNCPQRSTGITPQVQVTEKAVIDWNCRVCGSLLLITPGGSHFCPKCKTTKYADFVGYPTTQPEGGENMVPDASINRDLQTPEPKSNPSASGELLPTPTWIQPPLCPKCDMSLTPATKDQLRHGDWICHHPHEGKCMWFNYELTSILIARLRETEVKPSTPPAFVTAELVKEARMKWRTEVYPKLQSLEEYDGFMADELNAALAQKGQKS